MLRSAEMKTGGAKKRKRVLLEPDLEAIAGTWGPIQRLETAKMFRRWAHELEVSALMMCRDEEDDQGPSFSAKRRRVRRALLCPDSLKN